jgi:HlyD family secretion protein
MAGVTSVGGYYGYQRYYPAPVAAAVVNAVEVAKGNLQASVTATGTVAAPAQSKLTFKASGRLIELPVKLGDTVETGQVVARLDDSDLQVALAQAKNSVASAEVKLAQAKEGARAEDVQVSRASVETARTKLEQLRGYASGPDLAIMRSQVEQARIKVDQASNPTRAEDVDAARAQLSAARAKLTQIRNPRAEDVATAESQLQTQLTKLAQIQNPRAEDIRNAESSVASAKAKLQALLNPRAEDIANAQLSLDQQRTKLAQLVDAPRAKPEDIANAQLQVQNAQISLDKARYDQSHASDKGSVTSQAAADAQVLQASINLQTQQNNLSKLAAQGPTDWEVRLQQQAVSQAQISLDKIKSPLATDVQAAQIAVDQAKATLDKILAPSPYDVASAQESVNQAKITLDKLRSPLESDIAAAEQSVIQAEATLAKLLNPTTYDLQSAEESLSQSKASLERALTSNGYDIRNAESSLAQAQAQLDLKLAGPTALEIRAAEVSLEQAQVSLAQAQANLANAVIVAPFDGVVSATTGNLGEQISSGTAVVTLVDAKQLRIDVVVDETDIGKIAVGQSVTVSLEALAGQRFPASVKVVAPTATVQSGVVSYAIQVQLSPGATMVRPGMTATAVITTANREGVIVVPSRAIKTVQRNKTVDVQTADGKTETRPVQVGLANDSQTEIVVGLTAGERVILPTTAVRSVATGGGPPMGGGGPPRIG